MHRHFRSRLIAAFLLFMSSFSAIANIGLPVLISDGAVLQRDQPIPIWGTAPDNTEVSVTLGAAIKSTKSDADGNWQVTFDALPASATPLLSIRAGSSTKTVSDLIIGDVWISSGQSNMEWVLRDTNDGSAEIVSANSHRIRQIKIPHSWAMAPAGEVAGGTWLSATSEHADKFSAVAYYFAKKISVETGVPIGLINTSWGGSSIEAWMSPAALGKSLQATMSVVKLSMEANARKFHSVLNSLKQWPGTVVDRVEDASADWSAVQLATSDWSDIETPALWETQGFDGVNGVAWYRKIVVLSAAQASKDMVLGLGRIDDADVTWVNGHQVGSTQGYNIVREYPVVAKYLHPGINSIAVRVTDTGGGGGIYSSESLMYLRSVDGQEVSLAGTWKFRPDRVTVEATGAANQVETALYNKMLYPLFKVPVKGVIWYQGESNANSAQQAEQYADQFKALINDWRTGWHQPELPFYWIQLANFISNVNTQTAKPWAILRQSQTQALALANTGQVITIDVGNPKDIHPRDKKTVGNRLALIALNKTYGDKSVHYRGPVFQSVSVGEQEIVVHFDSDKGLTTRATGAGVRGFEVADGERMYIPVEGRVKGSAVYIKWTDGEPPHEIRYAWDDNPDKANLIDNSGLPAEPFRYEVEN